MEQVKNFVVGFFESLKCDVNWNNDVLIVENVPSGFENFVGKIAPYRLVFEKGLDGEFAGKGSSFLDSILKFLKRGGKTSILRIDFDIDAEAEIRKRLKLKNCELESLSRSYRNNFFTRFSFVVNFNYLNRSERVVEEVYVYDGEVVSGDLDGYGVLDGEKLEVDKDKVKTDYKVAMVGLQERLGVKVGEISEELKVGADVEVGRIREYYDKQLGELGGDLKNKLVKIKELELELRSCDEAECDGIRVRLDKLRKGLVKIGDDEAAERVLREREMTIGDAMQKFSLNVDRKLVNTTVIYYPRYFFKLHLKNSGAIGNRQRVAERLLEMSYDPLMKRLGRLVCEGCGADVVNLTLCAGGHVSCGECLAVCGECGKKFCVKCLKKGCVSCGRRLCRDCAVMCRGCGKFACRTHMRVDCVSGEERCVSCLRACLRCHGMCEERFFSEARDGSKVCMKCLGMERRGEVMGRVFE